MSSTSSPTVSRRWLALEMRRLRETARLSQRDVADALGCQVPKVSHLETGKRLLQDADLKTLLELFQVADPQAYLDEYANSQRPAWWDTINPDIAPDWYREFIGIEQGASRIRAYQPSVIHGLLQTADYARAMYRNDILGSRSEEEIARLVDVRVRRQERLTTDAEFLQLQIVLDEAVLRRVVGSREVMRAQVKQLLTLAAAPNIQVQIVPFDRGGGYEAMLGAFTILTFPFPSDVALVYMERRDAAEFLDSFAAVSRYSLTFQRLVDDLALSEADSMSLLQDVVKSEKPLRPTRFP
jgi:transcriptional regulator with XRE-family HTH domain